MDNDLSTTNLIRRAELQLPRHTAGMHQVASESTSGGTPPRLTGLRRLVAMTWMLAAMLGVIGICGPAATGTAAVPPEAAHARWRYPVHPIPEIIREFDLEHRYASGHRGVDLAAPPGAPVHAVDEGVVYFTGRVVDRSVVSVQHANGLRSTYEPVDASVSVGTHVSPGDALGTVARDTVHAPSGGLHLGARLGDAYLDPMLLLRELPPAILLPLS